MKNICTVPTEIPPQCFLLSLSLLNNFKAIYIVFFLFFISVQFSCSVVSDSANHQKLGILLYNYNTVTTLKKSESNSIVLSNTQKSSSPIKKKCFIWFFSSWKFNLGSCSTVGYILLDSSRMVLILLVFK